MASGTNITELKNKKVKVQWAKDAYGKLLSRTVTITYLDEQGKVTAEEKTLFGRNGEKLHKTVLNKKKRSKVIIVYQEGIPFVSNTLYWD